MNVAEEILVDLIWLESHLEPWHCVEEKWQNTGAARKAQRDSKNYNINDYLDRFKILRQPTGHLLVSYCLGFSPPFLR